MRRSAMVMPSGVFFRGIVSAVGIESGFVLREISLTAGENAVLRMT